MTPQVIAVFDFDGTITKTDSVNDFLKYKFGSVRFYITLLSLLPHILLYLLNHVSNQSIKEKLFGKYLKNMSYSVYKELATEYAIKKLPSIIKTEALKKIKWHQHKKHHIIIISASLYEWLKPWSEKNGIEEVISSKLNVHSGKLTGKLDKNCYGKEKVKLFLHKYPDRSSYYLYAYGDSQGDKDILNLADKKYYKIFHS